MKAASLFVLLAAMAFTADAHRLDEFMQATRVAIAKEHLELRLQLTPGKAVLPELWPLWDVNGDQRLSRKEQRAYANRMLRDLRVHLNNQPVALSLSRVEFPSVAALQEGDGVIRIAATGKIRQLRPGESTLFIRNNHLPAVSVYMVNALVPSNPSIRILRQERDETQQEYRLLLHIQ